MPDLRIHLLLIIFLAIIHPRLSSADIGESGEGGLPFATCYKKDFYLEKTDPKFEPNVTNNCREEVQRARAECLEAEAGQRKDDRSVIVPGEEAIRKSGQREINLRLRSASELGERRNRALAEKCEENRAAIISACEDNIKSLKEAFEDATGRFDIQHQLELQMIANKRYQRIGVEATEARSLCMQQNAKVYSEALQKAEVQAASLESEPNAILNPEGIDSNGVVKGSSSDVSASVTADRARDLAVEQVGKHGGEALEKVGAKAAGQTLKTAGKGAGFITPIVGAITGDGYDVIVGATAAGTCLATGPMVSGCVAADVAAQVLKPSEVGKCSQMYWVSPAEAARNGCRFFISPRSLAPQSVRTLEGAKQNERAISILASP